MISISCGKRHAAVRVMIGAVVALAMAAGLMVGLAGHQAQAAPAHQAPTVAVSSSGKSESAGRATADSSKPCFYTLPNCVSSDPTASFGIQSNGDTTGCTFTGDVSWGDGASSSQTFDGGSDGSRLANFDHKYSKDGVYSISWSVDVASGSCSNNSGILQFTLFPCPSKSQQTHVTLPTVDANVVLPNKSVTVSYGKLPLTFKTENGASNAVCTVRSNKGALPVIIHVPDAFTSLHVADSVTTATVDFIPADDPSTDVPTCDFSLLHALMRAVSNLTFKDFADTNNCLLNGSSHTSGTLIARWSIPGFAEYAPRASFGVKVYSTQPLTYYVDLDQLGGAAASDSFPGILQDTETFIHTTLIENLPMVDKIGIVQDPPANLLITDPLGRTVGMGSDHKVQTFPGAGYARFGKRSIAWIIEPLPGTYHVTADGKPNSQFHTDFTLLQFLGHGNSPLKSNTQWHGVLGHKGTAARKFPAKGTALQPQIRAHESRTRIRRHQTILFSLARSVVPFGKVKKVVWTFGDGKQVTGKKASHRYNKAGRFVPTVTVTDSLGTSVKLQLKAITVRR